MQVKTAPSTTHSTLAKSHPPAVAAPTVSEHGSPLLDTQQETGTRLGHSFGSISVFPPNLPIQPKHAVESAQRLPAFRPTGQNRTNPVPVISADWAVPLRVQAKCACGGEAGPDGECAACKAQRLVIQRQAQDEPAEREAVVQAQSDSAPAEAAPDLESRLNGSRGSGQALPAATQGAMESAFGADFGGVRVHTGSEAVQMNKELSAQAFTHARYWRASDSRNGRVSTMRTFAKTPTAAQQTQSTGPITDRRRSIAQNQSARSVLHLQRTIGNRAVQRLLKSNASLQQSGSPAYSSHGRSGGKASAPAIASRPATTGEATLARQPKQGAGNNTPMKMAVQAQSGKVIVTYEGASLLSIAYDPSKGAAQTAHFRNSDGAEMVQIILPPRTPHPDRNLDAPRYNQLYESGELTLSEIEPETDETGNETGYLYGLTTKPAKGPASKHTPAPSPSPASQPAYEPASQPVPEKPPAKSADELIDEQTTVRFLDEEKLGAELLKYAASGDAATVHATLDKLDSTDRDDVAVALVAASSDEQLKQIASTEEGRKLLLRLYDELSSGHLGEDEAKQAERVMQVRAQQIDPQQFIEAEDKAMVIPFSSLGFTKLSSATLSVKRLDNGNIWVRSHMKREHWQNAKRLPSMALVINGIELSPDQVVGLYLYDEGGKIVYVPAIYLLQLSNQEDTKVLTMAGEAFVTGATAGFGGGAVAGGEVTVGVWAARGLTVLRWADRAATAVMVASTLINDHRGLILKHFGKDGEAFLKHWSTVERVVAIYGLARGALALGQAVNALRTSYKNWRALRAEAKNLAAEEKKALDEIAVQTEKSLKELEEAQQNGAKAALPKGITEETVEMLAKKPELLDALVKNPRAAKALTLCKSPCIPEFATANQVDRIEKLLVEAEKRGLQLNQDRLKKYFHSAADEAALTKSIDDFDATLRVAQPGSTADTILDEAELLQQPGVRERRTPLGVLAKEGQEFDVLEGQKYPHNQVPMFDKGGSRRRLDSYDPIKQEIISRKSLAGSNGQLAFADEFSVIGHYQEFALKYPNGATIAGGPLKGQKVTGKYILEVKVQRYPIPERMIEQATVRGITIRDINGKVYN